MQIIRLSEASLSLRSYSGHSLALPSGDCQAVRDGLPSYTTSALACGWALSAVKIVAFLNILSAFMLDYIYMVIIGIFSSLAQYFAPASCLQDLRGEVQIICLICKNFY